MKLLLPESDSLLYALLRIGELSLDFEFNRARRVFDRIQDDLDAPFRELLQKNFLDLEEGDANAVFSELMYSIEIQRAQGQFTDFLGRIYRFNEAFFKFIFAKKEFSGKIDIYNRAFEENFLIDRLRRRYQIHGGNIIFSVEEYYRRNHRDDKDMLKVIDLLTDERMRRVIELRNNSIVGHGFGASGEESINEVFSDTQELVNRLRQALEVAGVRVYDSKYRRLNEHILRELKNK
ncbi:hypothetical protein [Guggenheimella bovis]